MGQGVDADEARLVLGREPMLTQAGRYLVVGAVATERDAANHVVALSVGLPVEAELRLAGDIGREFCVGLTATVVLVGHSCRLGVVVGVGQAVQTFVHRPVEPKAVLRTDEQAVVVVEYLVGGQLLRPYADIVQVACEAAFAGEAWVTAKDHVAALPRHGSGSGMAPALHG